MDVINIMDLGWCRGYLHSIAKNRIWVPGIEIGRWLCGVSTVTPPKVMRILLHCEPFTSVDRQ